MAGYNMIIIDGNLSSDVITEGLPDGTIIAKFSVACDVKFRKDTCYVNVTLFGGLAPNLSRYVKKGSRLTVIGELQQDRWTDKQTGKKENRYKVATSRVEFGVNQPIQQAPAPNVAQAAVNNYLNQPQAPDHGNFETQAEDLF